MLPFNRIMERRAVAGRPKQIKKVNRHHSNLSCEGCQLALQITTPLSSCTCRQFAAGGTASSTLVWVFSVTGCNESTGFLIFL